MRRRQSGTPGLVCDDALDRHAELGVVRDRCLVEADGTGPALIGMSVRERNARVVVDADEDVLPSNVPGSLAIVTCDSMADILEASDLLDVDVRQLAGCFALVALNHFRRPQVIAGTTAF